MKRKNGLRRATLAVATGAALVVPGVIAAPAALAAETPVPALTQRTTITVPVTATAPTLAPKPASAVAAVVPVKAAVLHSLSSTVSDRTVTVSGSGFQPNEALTLALDRSDGLSIPATVQANLAGTVSLTITATDAASGFYTLTATGTTSTAVSTSFELAKVYTYAPAATAMPTVTVGQPVTITGTGWTKGPVAVTEIGPDIADIVTPAVDGSFTATVTPQTIGAVVVTVTDGITTRIVTSTAEANTPTMSPTVSAVADQDRIIIKGTAFVPNSTVTLRTTPAFTYGPAAQVTSDANGNITASITVEGGPDFPAGTKVTVTATGDYNTTASTSVAIIDNVHPNAKLSTIAPVEQSAPIVVAGDGFRPNAKVSVYIDGVGRVDDYTDSDGKINVSMATNYDTTVGDHAVTVYAGLTVLTGTATVTEHIFHPVLSAPSQVQQGETFTVTGSGYKPWERVIIDVDGTTVDTETVNPDGTLIYQMKVFLNSPIGNRTVTARPEDGNRVSSITLLVVPRISPIISVTPVVTAGGYVKVTGSGFDPYGLISITIPGVGTFITLAEVDGTFGMHYDKIAYRVNTPGTYTLTLADTNGDVLQATFNAVPAVPVTPVDPSVTPPVIPEPVTPAQPAPAPLVAAVATNLLAFTSLDPTPRPEAAPSVVAPITAQKVSGQNSDAAQADPTPLVTPKADPAAVPADISKVSDDVNWIPYVFGGILVLVAAGGAVLVAARGRRARDSG
ncbi:hypothetical protein [Arthrobacter sp. B2a2-09]|uniref:hypothetical protein n=1 Tax=Arthrobacter sp. B2a2-09 TaxID=2952822 RepID=UPI0022CD9085|nr:hypothetical protein [Arthrobacter sp. B2a2-09]